MQIFRPMSDPKDDTKAETEEVKTPVPQEEPQAENDKPKVEKTTSGPNPFDWISTGTSWGASFVQSAKEKVTFGFKKVKKSLDFFNFGYFSTIFNNFADFSLLFTQFSDSKHNRARQERL